jgi:hypothetical protein
VTIIDMDLREIGWDGMDWIDLAQDRYQWRALVNTVMNLRVSYNFGKFLSSCTTGGFSRRAQLREVSYLFVYFKTNASELPKNSHFYISSILICTNYLDFHPLSLYIPILKWILER